MAFTTLLLLSLFAGSTHGFAHTLTARSLITTAPTRASVSDSQSSTLLFSSPDDELDFAESLGRGAAKSKRGTRKPGSVTAAAATQTKATKKVGTSGPEVTFYEGPPAITETLIPTISILTVIGIVPAAASWARQAWVRYKITNRRIRVNSGFRGKDMAEIIYPDVVELRTAKRLFGDGDLVAFLSDGAKFELRNVPNFDEFLTFVLDKLDDDVVAKYKAGGDVTNAAAGGAGGDGGGAGEDDPPPFVSVADSKAPGEE